MKKSKLIIIAGGSCNGKTEIINELAKRGYNTHPEVTRTFLEERKTQISAESYQNPSKEEQIYRQTEIYKRQFALESKLREQGGIHFLERGLIDMIGFNEHFLEYNLDITKQFPPGKYAEVFIPEKLNFQPDNLRTEKDSNEAQKIHDSIIVKYFEHGHRPYMVPTIEEAKEEATQKRTDFIMKTAAENGILNDVYKFCENEEQEEHLRYLKLFDDTPTKILDIMYEKIQNGREGRVYSYQELSRLLCEISPRLKNDSNWVEDIISTMLTNIFITHIWGGDKWVTMDLKVLENLEDLPIISCVMQNDLKIVNGIN